MSTTKIGLNEDERWPTYVLEEPGKYAPAAEVDDETLARWRAAIDAFDEVQAEMGDVYEAAKERQKREREMAVAEEAVAKAQATLAALRGES